MPEQVYLIPVWDTITTAWYKMEGSKGSIWAAIIIAVFGVIGLSIIELILSSIVPALEPILSTIIYLINLLFFTGIIFMAIKHVSNLSISYDMMFEIFTWPLVIKVLLVYILRFLIIFIPSIILVIGCVLFVIPVLLSVIGFILIIVSMVFLVFLYFRTLPALAFILDQPQLRPWEAIKSAFRVTRYNVLRLLAISIIASAILFISIIPLFIGLIWTLPFVYNLYGVVYKNLLQNEII